MSAWNDPEHPTPRRWLNQAQAAEYLGVTDRTVRVYVTRGTLTGHKIKGSRLIRFDVSDLDALMQPIPIPTADGAA
ncbi:helix-turn-helix domain-containing protein [Nocardioides panzhihuensis]|uniref:Excisionase family DNA binding protein n=1 Tax=Nocardioides panzhihuensis TaxID=860243 RepID=A0A7Z0DN79_9ACTN|nr:excisionase family DNA binding protein [Nocardioides panzhihuensis]